MIHAKLASIEVSVHDLDDSEDSACALEEYRDQVTEVRGELSKLKMSLLNSKAAPGDPIMEDQAKAEKTVFDCLLGIKKCLRSIVASPAPASEATVTKLPKLELPAFHGDILHWRNFWEILHLSS